VGAFIRALPEDKWVYLGEVQMHERRAAVEWLSRRIYGRPELRGLEQTDARAGSRAATLLAFQAANWAIDNAVTKFTPEQRQRYTRTLSATI
jgi:hypothetical protein